MKKKLLVALAGLCLNISSFAQMIGFTIEAEDADIGISTIPITGSGGTLTTTTGDFPGTIILRIDDESIESINGTQAVPEPSTAFLLSSGLIALLSRRRRP